MFRVNFRFVIQLLFVFKYRLIKYCDLSFGVMPHFALIFVYVKCHPILINCVSLLNVVLYLIILFKCCVCVENFVSCLITFHYLNIVSCSVIFRI